MTKDRAMVIAVWSLRHHFLQGNSQIYNVQAFLIESITEALYAIGATSRKKGDKAKLKEQVEEILAGPEPWVPKTVSF